MAEVDVMYVGKGDVALVVEGFTEIFMSTQIGVWGTLQQEGMYPYLIHRGQQI
jgi:hypothetical protein